MRSERDLLFEIEAAKAGGDRSAEGRLLLELAHTIPLFTVNLERIGWTLMSAREILGEESEESCMRRMAEVFFSAGNFSQLREAIEEIEKGKSNLRAGHYEIVRARFRLRDNGIDAAIGELGQLGEYRGGDPSFDAHLDIATAEARIAGFEFNAALESAARAVETLENRESGSPALLFNALFIKSIALLLKGDYTAAGKAGAGAVKTAGEHESAFEMYVSGALHGIILLSLSRNDEAKSVLE
ncbi:MAG: hypothetical protein FJ088_01900, partial [Deltaproteobacteria bacterium]|nr:hypothetical protein [Deltaproteobacteria bacterium]